MKNGSATPRPHSLAYVGIETPDAERWRSVGPGVFGFEARTDTAEHAVLLRTDDRHHRLAAVRGERNRLAYLGWEVADIATLDAIADRIEGAGLTIDRDVESLRAPRHFARVAVFTDPFGATHELAYNPADTSAFTPGRVLQGRFITGDGGFGHAVLMVPNREAATAFYVDVLGLKHSDTIIENGFEVRFFHTNPRHHSLAFVEIPNVRGLHHLMFEVSQLDDVGRAFNLLPEFGLPVTMSLGRHPNDRMFSFYARVPGGFEVEYGYDGLRIGNETPWTIGHFDRLSEWGHKPDAAAGPPQMLEPVAGFAPSGASAPVAAAVPAAGASLAGSWSTLTKTPMGDQHGTAEIVERDGVVTGTMIGPGGAIPIYDGTFDGTTAAWKIDITQPFTMTIEFTASLDANGLGGQAKAGDFGSSPFSAQRVGVAAV